MEFSASARDRLYRKLEPLVGAEEADYLMASLPPGGWDEVATTSDVRELTATLRGEMAELRSDLKTDLAEIRSEMVTRTELREQLQLHVDARIGAISRTWFFGTMAMQAATIGGIIAAIRL
jgi:hypothetical protein